MRDLADKLDQGMTQQRFDFGIEIMAINAIDLGRNF